MMTASTYRKWAAEMRMVAKRFKREGRRDLSEIALASSRAWEARARVAEMFKT